nr:serine/threonine-protein kinase kic1 [Quercus suber]
MMKISSYGTCTTSLDPSSALLCHNAVDLVPRDTAPFPMMSSRRPEHCVVICEIWPSSSTSHRIQMRRAHYSSEGIAECTLDFTLPTEVTRLQLDRPVSCNLAGNAEDAMLQIVLRLEYDVIHHNSVFGSARQTTQLILTAENSANGPPNDSGVYYSICRCYRLSPFDPLARTITKGNEIHCSSSGASHCRSPLSPSHTSACAVMPHNSFALFALQPLTKRATHVLQHPDNMAFVGTSTNGRPVLDVGQVRSRSGFTTLVTLGRGDADILVPFADIAKIQCSFELDPATQFTVLWNINPLEQISRWIRDRQSASRDYAVHPRLARTIVNTPLPSQLKMRYLRYEELGASEHGVVHRALDVDSGRYMAVKTLRQVNMASDPQGRRQWDMLKREVDNLAKLSLASLKDGDLKSLIESGGTPSPDWSWQSQPRAVHVHPRLARTIVNTPLPSQLKMRYLRYEELGASEHGVVHRALDVDSGRYMAVKTLRQVNMASDPQGRRQWDMLKREVDNLAKLSLASLKDGDLKSLIESGGTPSPDAVLQQMLEALSYLATEDIIHRDVKPANICWERIPNNCYHFQLGAFGVCNVAALACTREAGSPLSMAPEVDEAGKQTPKADVWSLFVTMLWVLDVEGFRDESLYYTEYHQARTAVLDRSQSTQIHLIKQMADLDPETRASADDMLRAHWGS